MTITPVPLDLTKTFRRFDKEQGTMYVYAKSLIFDDVICTYGVIIPVTGDGHSSLGLEWQILACDDHLTMHHTPPRSDLPRRRRVLEDCGYDVLMRPADLQLGDLDPIQAIKTYHQQQLDHTAPHQDLPSF